MLQLSVNGHRCHYSFKDIAWHFIVSLFIKRIGKGASQTLTFSACAANFEVDKNVVEIVVAL